MKLARIVAMAANLLYYCAVACIAVLCVRQNRIRFSFGHKFSRLAEEYHTCPPLTYARLYAYDERIGMTAENFDKPARYVLIVPSENCNEREVLKLFYLVEKLKLEGLRYEVLVSSDPALRAGAMLIFEKNKYKFQKFPERERRIYWKYPRFLELSGNAELSESFRRIRRCILNYYHRNKYEDDLFYRLIFDFFMPGREGFLRRLSEILNSNFDGLNRESEGLLFPFDDDEQGVFYALALYHLSSLHIDLYGEGGTCVDTVRQGRFSRVLTRREDSLGNIFFPMLESYLARAENSDLKSFNYLCALKFKEHFDWKSVSFQKRIEDDNLLFLLGYSGREPAAALAEFHERARLLRHNQPEQEDFLAASVLYLVLLSKILKINVREERMYFGTPREVLPLSVSCFDRKIRFEPTEAECINNSISLKSDKRDFTIFVT